MPRRIDAAERTEAIASAALRVLERDGLAGLSVRGVAAEAGIAAASLRRAFPTQHALREYCFEVIEERATARIQALDLTGRARAEGLLAQLLPLDAERRMELVAQVQLGVLALTDEELRPAAERLGAGVARACEVALGLLAQEGLLDASRDPDYEARRLRALLDGVAMHGLWSGSPEAAEQMLGTLARHLDELATPEG
ncbi:TetR family transcriptional regulator C-terminal domain-containing protein [Flavimobilis sp. GY10621]|uniref:TetR family transcriptional regulator C-terminal domain-containing protein n=1 Tax=Flavimobilis rhizosphaerae TaxID=2775421 RepID=A0ABR9DN38_9MICO|nr:TetR family transcriptional regulator C-terminal domain-containing protein [Flavimobilis rhizosphaerae]MBD9698535.1 TetR family transcriptional regulator C-terminal domain-containing protein [Flavimobilis rhizosphaerae]